MQMNLMIAISALAGVIAAGFVWLSWGLARSIAAARRKRAEDDALLKTAKEPPADKRPK